MRRPGLWRGPGDLLAVYHLMEAVVAAQQQEACRTNTRGRQQRQQQQNKDSVEQLQEYS